MTVASESKAQNCKSFSLASLRSRIAFFQTVTLPLGPPVFFLPGTCEEKNIGAEDLSSRWQASSRRLNARMPHHHHRESIRLSSSPSMISAPLAAASDIILFGVNDNEMDDSFSKAASDAEELSGSVTEPALFPSPALRQTPSGWRAYPRYDKGGQRTQARMVSAWGTISQQAGRVVSSGVPSGPLPMLVPVHPRSTWRAHKIVPCLDLWRA